MKKKNNYPHLFNCKFSEEDFNQLKKIREKTGISISKLIRDNITFLIEYYK